MIKNNSIELGTYVSPAVKVTQINPRRVMCISPGNLDKGNYSNSGYAGGDGEEEDGGSLFGF